MGADNNGQPEFGGGMRGLVERNTMRYHHAGESFLGALSLKPSARFESGSKTGFWPSSNTLDDCTKWNKTSIWT